MLIKELLKDQWYLKPHALYEKYSLKRLELVFMDALYKLEHEYLSTPYFTKARAKEWFFTTDKRIHELTGISTKTISRLRQGMRKRGLIQCHQKFGTQGKAMHYRIMLVEKKTK